MAGISSRLCSGTQSGGVSVVALETTRTTELLPEHLCAAERPCSSRAQADAPQIYSGDGLLAAGRPLSLVSILCGTQYVSRNLINGTKESGRGGWRLPAPEIERTVASAA